jgi:hypothetical protein
MSFSRPEKINRKTVKTVNCKNVTCLTDNLVIETKSTWKDLMEKLLELLTVNCKINLLWETEIDLERLIGKLFNC